MTSDHSTGRETLRKEIRRAAESQINSLLKHCYKDMNKEGLFYLCPIIHPPFPSHSSCHSSVRLAIHLSVYLSSLPSRQTDSQTVR